MLLVVLYHVDHRFSFGFAGVDIFFVISGFVITASLKREYDATGELRFGSFLRRRVKRLVPALLAMLVVTSLVSIVMLHPDYQVLAFQTALGASFAVSNVVLMHQGTEGQYFRPSPESNPFLHTWSLGVEEQLYLAVFIVSTAVLFVTKGRPWLRRATLALVLVVAAAMSLAVVRRAGAVTSLLGLDVLPNAFAFYSPAARLWEFAVGSALALVPISWQRFRRLCLADLAFFSLFAWLVASSVWLSASNNQTIVVAVVAAAVVCAAGATSVALSWLLAIRPLTWIGDRSYGWYLWHWPAVSIAAAAFPGSRTALVAAACASLAPAALSWRYLEGGGQKRRGVLGFRSSRAVLVALATAIAVPLLALPLARDGYGLTLAKQPWASGQADREWCQDLSGYEFKADDGFRCLTRRWDGSGEPRLEVLLIGDSHAGALAPVVEKVGHDLDAAVSVWWLSACPFIRQSTAVRLAGGACVERVSELEELLRQREYDVVVLTQRLPEYLRRGIGKQELERDLRWAVDVVVASGAAPVLVQTVPEFPLDIPHTVSMIRPGGVKPVPPVTDQAVTTAEEIERTIAADVPAVRYVPTRAAMCRPGCAVRSANVWMYIDDNHVSVDALGRLYSPLRHALSAMLKESG